MTSQEQALLRKDSVDIVDWDHPASFKLGELQLAVDVHFERARLHELGLHHRYAEE